MSWKKSWTNIKVNLCWKRR